MTTMQRITSNLWFDKQAEDAANYYVGIFNNSRIGKISHYGTEGFEIRGMTEGTAMVVEFFLEGQQFLGLNGGPHFKFTEAISFVVNCDTQEEINYYWEKLSDAGDPKAQMCGWLKDKFGLSWQIVPAKMREWATDPDQQKTERLMKAVLQMKKIDILRLERAFEGK